MKNVTMYFALALVFVLGTDAVYGQFEEKAETKKPRNYWTEIQETRRVFGMASEALTTKEQLNLLDLCQKAREAGIIRYAYGSFRDNLALRICWPGPFYSKEGRRDGQVVCQMISVRAYFAHAAATNEFDEVWGRTKKSVQSQITGAVCDNLPAGGYTVYGYQVEQYHKSRPNLSRLGILLDYVMALAGSFDAKESREWKGIFVRLAKPGQFSFYAPALDMSCNERLLAGQDGNGISKFNGALTTNEFLFLQRQEDQIWEDALNPSKELQSGLPGTTYWKRDADPNEPALVLKAPRGWCSWGGCCTINLRSLASNSFLKGLCLEWRNELDGFEASLPNDDIPSEFVDFWRYGAASEYGYGHPSAAKQKWTDQMRMAEQTFYFRYFAVERLRWYRVTAGEYEKATTERDRWLSLHNSPSFLAKLKLCTTFEKIVSNLSNDGGDGAGGTTLGRMEGKPSDKVAFIPVAK